MAVSDYLNQHVNETPYIGAFHSTSELAFSNIIKSRSIIARNDRNNIVYFFYGKPSYTLKSNGAVINEVSFAYKSKGLENIDNISPFDTGGLISGRYFDFFGHHTDYTIATLLHYFSIPANFEAVSKFVHLFFGDNRSYLDGKLSEWPAVIASEALLISWGELVKAASKISDFDPPANTIEIQACSPCAVDKQGVQAVIMPLGYLDRPEIIEFFKETGIPFETYEDEVLADKSSLWSTLIEMSRLIQYDDVQSREL